MAKFTDAQRTTILSQVRALQSQGLTLKEACKEAGISTPTQYMWAKKLKKKNKTVDQKEIYPSIEFDMDELQRVNTGDDAKPLEQQVICMIGSPSAIAELLKQW